MADSYQGVVDEEPNINDVIIAETLQEQGWCRKAAILSDTNACAEDNLIGMVLEADGSDYIKCTTGANASAILLTKVTQEDNIAADQPIVVLYRGPALVKTDSLIIAANQLADAKTALIALGIEFRDAPASQTTQTT